MHAPEVVAGAQGDEVRGVAAALFVSIALLGGAIGDFGASSSRQTS